MIAGAVARQRLASVHTDRPVAPAGDCVITAIAAGVPISEIQRTMGASRQTVYNAKKSVTGEVRRPRPGQLREEVLILVAAKAAYGSPANLANAANLDPTAVISAMDDLAAQGHIRIFRDETNSVAAEPTDATFLALRFDFDRLYRRRDDATSIYLQLPDHPETKREILAAALGADTNKEVSFVPRSTAPSRMRGDELAFISPTPTIREAIQVAREFWSAVVAEAEVDPPKAPIVIADIIPPGGRPVMASAVLDALLERLFDANVHNGQELRRIRAEFTGDADERTLALRCASEAAHAVSSLVGVDRTPRLLTTGDDAFAEHEAIVAIANDVRFNRPAEYGPVAATLEHAKRALNTAIEHAGPLPGGRLAGSPLREVRPTREHLVEIAIASADAVAAASSTGHLNLSQTMTRIAIGPPTQPIEH